MGYFNNISYLYIEIVYFDKYNIKIFYLKRDINDKIKQILKVCIQLELLDKRDIDK